MGKRWLRGAQNRFATPFASGMFRRGSKLVRSMGILIRYSGSSSARMDKHWRSPLGYSGTKADQGATRACRLSVFSYLQPGWENRGFGKQGYDCSVVGCSGIKAGRDVTGVYGLSIFLDFSRDGQTLASGSSDWRFTCEAFGNKGRLECWKGIPISYYG